MNIIKDISTKSAIAFTIIFTGFAAICFIPLSDAIDNRIFDLMFLVGAYFFGSSSSSTKKDETIASLSGQSTVTNADTVNVKK